MLNHLMFLRTLKKNFKELIFFLNLRVYIIRALQWRTNLIIFLRFMDLFDVAYFVCSLVVEKIGWGQDHLLGNSTRSFCEEVY